MIPSSALPPSIRTAALRSAPFGAMSFATAPVLTFVPTTAPRSVVESKAELDREQGKIGAA